jgi:hypothetical protein
MSVALLLIYRHRIRRPVLSGYMKGHQRITSFGCLVAHGRCCDGLGCGARAFPPRGCCV